MSELKTALEVAMARPDGHPIPPITHPLGQHWRQPDRHRILIDDKTAVMTRADFNTLAEYSTSVPTGVYEGKMWKRHTPDGWYLVWFGFSQKPDCCSNNYRKIEVV